MESKVTMHRFVLLVLFNNIWLASCGVAGVSSVSSSINRHHYHPSNDGGPLPHPSLDKHISNIINTITNKQGFEPTFIDATVEKRDPVTDDTLSEDIEPMDHPHGHEHHGVLHTDHHGDHEHFSTENTDQNIGLDIERFDETILKNSTAIVTDNTDEPTGRSVDIDLEFELCNMCLCDNDHSGISCQGQFKEDKVLTLDASLIPLTAKYIIIKGYDEVIVQNETFSDRNLRLQYIEFIDIEQLTLEAHSLHFNQRAMRNIEVKITFKNCKIPVLDTYTLTQLAHTEHEEDTNVLAPEDTRYLTLEIYRCTIGEIMPRALYLARMLYVNITDSTIEKMSPKSVDLSVYEEWVIQDSNLPYLPSSAVCIHAKKSVVIARNKIERIGHSAWHIEAAGQVLFDFNIVQFIEGYAFQNITPELDSRVANIVFVNNSVIHAEPNALVTSDLYPRHERKVLDNKFEFSCACNISTVFESLLDIRSGDYADSLLQRGVLMNSLCRPEEGVQYRHINRYLRSECAEIPIFRIVIVVVIAVILISCISVAVYCAKKAKMAQEEVSYLGECSTRSFSTLNTHAAPLSPGICDNKNIFYDQSGNPSWIVAVPEVKTYQETEVHVTYEESHPLRNSVRNSTRGLPPCTDIMDNQHGIPIRQSCPFN